ncbi:SGNH/GDSL hydrolase family protein [Neobacillus niacini]|uniref:SGNH/GDSL hydrolase family protein n=1 Tax=Neobacillus niacini TaxID=86668 RepID=UPI002FFECC5E
MKYFLTAIWALVCIGVLAYSHIHWNQQTAVEAVEPELEPVVKKASNNSNNIEIYMKLAKNWPQTAKEQFKLALEEEKPFRILFVGSSASEWEKAVSQNIIESYGSKRITTAKQIYDVTSEEYLAENKHVELAVEKAQLVVIEPFLLIDNGTITIDATLSNLTEIIEAVKAKNPNTTFILQPSNPIYLPKYYATQVEGLKGYAKENNLTYLDHWTAWPATDDPKIKDYVVEGKKGPTEKGNEAWAQFLVEYFVNK